MGSHFAANELDTGNPGSLDSLDGTKITSGSTATVITDSGIHSGYAAKSSGAAVNSPDVIAPRSNAGSWRWHRCDATNSTKADKVNFAVSGNLIELDSDGNLVDSGVDSSNVLNNIVEDTIPQLGGDLESNGYFIKNAITLNANSINTEYIIPTGYNALSVGPIDINATITVNSTWEII